MICVCGTAQRYYVKRGGQGHAGNYCIGWVWVMQQLQLCTQTLGIMV